MTTKNPEYVFDLQAFALVITTDTGVSASDLSVDYSSEVATISATSNHVVVNAGWTANETVSYIHTNIKDDSDTSIPESDTYVYYNNDQYNYYGFASTDTSEATTITQLDGGTVVETAVHANSDATITAATLPSSGVAFTNQTVGAHVTIKGGGEKNAFSLSGVGDISNLTTNANLGLYASGSNLKIDHVSGEEVILTPNTDASGNVALSGHNINGAAISATLASTSAVITLNGGEGTDVTITSSADAILGSVDDKQTWNLSSQKLAYNRLEVSGAVAVTGADAAGSYLAVTAGNENPVTFDTVSGRTLVDSVSVDGTVLGGVGVINAVVTKSNDTEMTVNAQKQGLLSAGSTGGTASLATGANAVISVTDAGPAITGVDKLANNGKWVLGSSATVGTLGSDTVTFATGANTIAADANGTQVKGLNFAGGNAILNAVGAHDTVSVNGGAASWSFDGDSVSAVFDTVGSVSVSSANDVKISLLSNEPKTLSAGENGGADTLVLAKNGSVAITENLVSNASGLLNGSEWLVRGISNGDARTVTVGSRSFTFENQTDSVYGALKAATLNNANGGTSTITGIDSLSGNVTVTHYDGAISNLDVMGTTWNVANDDSETVIFASTGNAASVTANTNSDLSISASADASVQVAIASGNTVRGIFNHVTVTAHDDESPFGIQFEASDTAAGVAGINGLNSAATIRGDNHVLINDTFDINKAGASNSALANNIQFTLGSGDMTVKNVVSGDNYNGTGGRIFYDVTSSVSAGGNVNITINSATATINATTDSAISNVYIISDGTGDSAIETIGGVKLNDTITSVTDRNFTVVYDTSSINSDTEYTMLVNGAGITVDGADLVGDNSTIGVNVDNSGSKPVVSLSSGVISNGATVTVGAGVYNVGGNAAVTVNDDIGYLYFDSNNGSVTAEDFSVAEVRTRREGAIGNLVDANSDTTVHAFNDFYNAYYPNSNGYGFIGSSINSTVAGYASVTTSAPSLGAVSGGINIYGNASLNGSGTAGYPNSVTLQSFVANPINVQHYEGLISGTATLNNAVIDVSGGNNTLVAIGVDGSNFSTNHTILGSARQSTLVVGSNATGDNVVQAGNGGNYIYHNTNNGAKASLFGGTGSDTIYASTGDHVEGGGGRDFFYDANAIEISDYNFDDGDIIIATKLSASTPLTPDNIQFSGNRVSIASGAEITVGAMANYDEATATRAVIANAGNDTTSTKFVIWAGNYESSLDASNFTKSAYMFSQMNEGRADTIIGSAFADTIYAGGNDFVDGGTGNDYIQLYGDSGQNGATVVLTEGGNIVNGWSTGFDNSAGSNILAADALSLNFRTRNDQIIAYSGSSSITFSDLSVSSAADFLVGESKVTFIKNGQIATVSSNDDIADYYKAERAGGISVGSGVTTEFTVSLGSDQFASVNSLYLENESKATVYGSNANETISVSGSADNGARKYVAAGGGNDTIYSGGNASSVAGNFFYFGTYNNYTYSSGNNDIYNYSFYKSTDADYSTSDLIYLGASSNYSSLSVNADRAEIALTDDTKVRIHGEGAFSNTDNKIVRVQFGDDEKIYNTKLGMTSSVNAFTYDGVTDLYLGNTGRGRDTLNVASDLGNVNIWLNDKNLDKNTYAGVGVINAGNVADTKLTLAGSGSNNTIVSGGNNTSTSLWGGGGESNSLIGGNGEDTFFYFKQYGYTDNDGNFHSSNDKIDRVDSNDLIWLYDVQLSDIDADKTSIASNQITVGLTNGSSIVVTNMSQETNFRLSNGNGGWQDVKAVNRGNNRYWE